MPQAARPWAARSTPGRMSRAERSIDTAGRAPDAVAAVVLAVRAAAGFLTRIPVAGQGGTGLSAASADAERTTGAGAFGLVGAFLGALAGAPLLVLGSAHPVLAGLIVVAVLAALAGGLHLDGLGDTWDALAAGPGRAEQARTDPRAGSAGVVAIVVVLGLEVAAIAELVAAGPAPATAAVVTAAAASRAVAPCWAVIVGRRARPGRGLGRWFADNTSTSGALTGALSAVGVAIVLAVLVGPTMLLGASSGLAIATLATALVLRGRRQLDGDGYGLAIETTFAAVLVATAVLA
jgi:adenosylcobinamide-GDP ribazoletransferase